MIVLDTNVVSEIMKPDPEPAVAKWLQTLGSREAGLAATSLAELYLGLRILPEGRRRTALADRLARFMQRVQVLPFEARAADAFATLVAQRRRAGNPISHFDGQIAAIARARGATVATRDMRGFAGCGIDIIDPWASH